MSKEKQIEEMAKDLAKNAFFYNGGCLMNYSNTAKLLYNAGYRKAEEIAREIFEEIENALDLLRKGIAEGRKNDGIKYQQLHDGRILSLEAIGYFTAELKKKYTEMEKDNG